MANNDNKCPICGKLSSKPAAVLRHVFAAMNGQGDSPNPHIKWAAKNGVRIEDMLFQGKTDEYGLPGSDLGPLKAILYPVIGAPD